MTDIHVEMSLQWAGYYEPQRHIIKDGEWTFDMVNIRGWTMGIAEIESKVNQITNANFYFALTGKFLGQ